MHRRALLAAAGTTTIGALAGCLADGGFADTGTPTATPEPCERDREDPPESGGEIEPRELPDRPDEWTEASIETYLREYEAAYRQHLILTENTTAYGHSESVQAIRQVDEGYRVELRTNFYYNEGTHRGEVHADSPRYTVVYLVAADRLLRVEAERHDVEPSLENARTMECW